MSESQAPRAVSSHSHGIDAALSIVGNRLQYWERRRLPGIRPGQVETELRLLEARLNDVKRVGRQQ